MKQLYAISMLLLLVLLTGCEKSIAGEESDNGTIAAASLITDDMKRTALTVAEAQEVDAGTDICVKGYLVAAVQNSIGNADFKAPFDGSTAVVLADAPSDASSEQFSKDELFPVSLTDAEKGLRDTYNMEDNPQHWNSFVYILGKRTKYMSVPGLKKVLAIEVDPNHTPDSHNDGGNGTGGDGGSGTGGGTGGDDGGGDDGGGDDGGGDGGGNGTEYYAGQPVQTIAHVIDTYSQQETTNISIKAYIIGFTTRNMSNVKFENMSADDFTAIVLSDTPAGDDFKDNYDSDNDRYKLFPVGIAKSLRQKLESAADSQMWNKLIYVHGTLEQYMGQAGFKSAYAATFENPTP